MNIGQGQWRSRKDYMNMRQSGSLVFSRRVLLEIKYSSLGTDIVLKWKKVTKEEVSLSPFGRLQSDQNLVQNCLANTF